MDDIEKYDAYLEKIIIFIILNEVSEMSSLDIYNKWQKDEGIKITSGKLVRRLLNDISTLKNVDKNFLTECLE